MAARLIVALLCVLGLAACADQALMQAELRLRSRNVQITIENRTGADRAIWYTATTLDAREIAPACETVTVTYEPEPDQRGGIGPPESWSFVIGEPIYAPDGNVLGVRGPFSTVASSVDDALEPTTAAIFIRIGSDEVQWRTLTADEAVDLPAGPGC